MKKYLFILLICCNAIVAFGQDLQKETAERKQGLISYNIDINDSDSIEVIDLTNEDTELNKPPLVFINGNISSTSVLSAIAASQIDSFRIEKTDTIINDVYYFGKIYVTTKDGYFLNPVSLELIKEKYSDNKPTVFIVNDEIITGELKDYLLDENYILQITKGRIQSLGINYVSILTKTEENKEKVNNKRFRIR